MSPIKDVIVVVNRGKKSLNNGARQINIDGVAYDCIFGDATITIYGNGCYCLLDTVGKGAYLKPQGHSECDDDPYLIWYKIPGRIPPPGGL